MAFDGAYADLLLFNGRAVELGLGALNLIDAKACQRQGAFHVLRTVAPTAVRRALHKNLKRVVSFITRNSRERLGRHRKARSEQEKESRLHISSLAGF